uniref:Ion_trans domain-containing protein n=1 Tax=Taenia asiatica TaxID=60517 RepID=A0A0R3W6U2_TAEAS
LATLPRYCGATFKDKAIEAMRNPLVNWSDYSVEFASAFGIFIVSLIGLVIVLIVFVVEFCLGVYKALERQARYSPLHKEAFPIISYWAEMSLDAVVLATGSYAWYNGSSGRSHAKF